MQWSGTMTQVVTLFDVQNDIFQVCQQSNVNRRTTYAMLADDPVLKQA